jgi:two-component system, probable response regulator PhcQ
MTRHKFTVLFVDDEDESRECFRTAFEDDFEVLTAANAEEAWSIITSTPNIGVIISDQRMPGQQGTELLIRIRRHYPGVIRILTTAYADMGMLIDAINNAAIYRYVVKPWDLQELRVILTQALESVLVHRESDDV